MFPTRKLGEMLLTKPGGAIVTPIAKATIYGERYAVVFHRDSDQPYVYKMDSIGFAAPTTMKEAPVFHYSQLWRARGRIALYHRLTARLPPMS